MSKLGVGKVPTQFSCFCLGEAVANPIGMFAFQLAGQPFFNPVYSNVGSIGWQVGKGNNVKLALVKIMSYLAVNGKVASAVSSSAV